MDALARKLQPLPPIIHRKINLERKDNCKINLERKANCKIKLIMSLFFGNAPTLGAFLKKGLSRLNINGPIGVQNLFCEGPIGMHVILRRPDWNACYFAKARLECKIYFAKARLECKIYFARARLECKIYFAKARLECKIYLI